MLETKLDDLGADVRELASEERRTRKRLHDLEGVAGALVDVNRDRQRQEKQRQEKVARRLSILTVFIAAAALGEPFLYHLLTGR